MTYSSFIVFGVLLLHAIVISADKCDVHNGVSAVPCPGGGVPKEGDGDGSASSSKGPTVLEPCVWYKYIGPKGETYEVNTAVPYRILVDENVVPLGHQITIRKFWCSINGVDPDECVVYVFRTFTWPPILLRQDKFKRFCIRGKGMLKFMIITSKCNECDKWPGYECTTPQQCNNKKSMYVEFGCPKPKVCCRKPRCENHLVGNGNKCVPNTPFPRPCPPRCKKDLFCKESQKECCTLCGYRGIKEECVPKEKCIQPKKATGDACCPEDNHVCCSEGTK